MMYAICQKEEMGFDKAVEVRISTIRVPSRHLQRASGSDHVRV